MMLDGKLPRANQSAVSRGFTLTELLIVIGVIALLMGLLVPGMGLVRQKAREASTLSLMGAVEQAAFMFRTDHNRMPGYFETGDIASIERNPQHVTNAENVVLDLAGGIVSNDTPVTESRGIFEVQMGGAAHKVGVMETGASDGPGYLDLGQVHIADQTGDGTTFAGNKVFRPMADEDVYISDADRARPIPVVHDYFGKPLLMWSRNPTAGDNTDFADITSDLVRDDSGRPRRALYYWWQNAGMLGASSQYEMSVIGADVSQIDDTEDNAGGIRKIMVPSMYAILGHPAFHKTTAAGSVTPTVGLGELVLQSGGADRVFLSHNGQDGSDATPEGRNGRIRAYYTGNQTPPKPNERLMSEFDDLVHAGG